MNTAYISAQTIHNWLQYQITCFMVIFQKINMILFICFKLKEHVFYMKNEKEDFFKGNNNKTHTHANII